MKNIFHQNSDPTIRTVSSEMPVEHGWCWYLRWDEDDYQRLAHCAYRMLPATEFDEGLGLTGRSSTLQHWCSRIALRQALSRYAEFAKQPQEWRLDRLRSGKLTLNEPSGRYRDIDFSISHVPGLAACALSSGAYIGVDVEPVHREFDSTLICGKVFSSAELQHIRLTSRHERSKLALKLWTLKEACSKAAGLGLALDYSRIELELSAAGGFRVQDVGLCGHLPACRWRVNQHVLGDQYFLSLSGATPVASGRTH